MCMQLCATAEFCVYLPGWWRRADDGGLGGVIDFFSKWPSSVFICIHCTRSSRLLCRLIQRYPSTLNPKYSVEYVVYTHIFWRYVENLNICRKSNWIFIVIVCMLFVYDEICNFSVMALSWQHIIKITF